ncbi:hypothetical protein A1O3_01746 [Capronia epimyces CBS 606.96]|uniref:Zn(2)-C6 fungal-type domain-containing protein n=1 Tax=Capronia epimyces CBS 606.96 TaxID=1182542 RepID=W9ZF95_9EURO|nr:uncharacterized protein A1O3_01746 [Capronia epimyces CBS 606.96]EXJ93189.1 hypothetical protein A1O3_01746 [Capronia epimyces CBS 606.96]
MGTRSRYGCIDCKKAKVKCDEVYPACGTCKRRGRQCSGYRHIATKAQKAPGAPTTQITLPCTTSPEATFGLSLKTGSATDEAQTHEAALSSVEIFSPSDSDASSITAFSPTAKNNIPLAWGPLPLRTMAVIPPGAVQPTDEPFIEVYFLRHPADLVFGGEFVQEMNSNVLKVFQNSPQAVSDSLSAIGETYLQDKPLPVLVFVPNRKARILARLRNMDKLGVSLELLLLTFLGLCAVELVDAGYCEDSISTIPALMENLAMMLEHYLHRGLELSQLSKYFVRALARQDMMIALSRFHRPRIPTAYWLDDYARQHLDRFMGYTGPLMPLLAELCALAEDIRIAANDNPSDEDLQPATFSISRHHSASLLDRASQLQSRLELWHPTIDPQLSFESSRKFLMHANAYRSSSLLYLHRLFRPPGSSMEADQRALTMAYEVLVHTTASDEDVKMSLWPVFLASCEMNSEADRMSATQIMGAVCRGRNIVTTLRTRSFVINRVWPARDAGLDWNWRTLAQQYPNELLPI